MTKNKTTENENSVKEFIERIEHERKKEEAYVLLKIFEDITQLPAKMWGPSIIGFGSYHYKYDSGREGDMPLIAYSPRQAKISLYFMDGSAKYEKLLLKLGKHKTSKACLYINKLADIDLSVLQKMITNSFNAMQKCAN